MKNIWIALALIFLILTTISFLLKSTPWLGIMLLFGGTIGIVMFISYPMVLIPKILVSLILLVSLVFIIYGFRNAQTKRGQILAVSGILIWSLLGTVYGLSTGT